MAMTLRLTEEEHQALLETAKREHISMQEAARRAIVEYATRLTNRRNEAIVRIAAERRDLLRRLGDA